MSSFFFLYLNPKNFFAKTGFEENLNFTLPFVQAGLIFCLLSLARIGKWSSKNSYLHYRKIYGRDTSWALQIFHQKRQPKTSN